MIDLLQFLSWRKGLAEFFPLRRGCTTVKKAETMTLNIAKICLPLAIALLATPPAFAQQEEAKSKIAERDLREMKKLLPGVYTNEEQVSFQSALGVRKKDHVARSELIIERKGESFTTRTSWSDGRSVEARHIHRVSNGEIVASTIRNGRADCSRTFTREFDLFHGEGCGGAVVVSPEGFNLTVQGKTYKMLRARTFKCWVSPRKTDGSYAFYNDLVLHDQGGRVWIEATAEHPRVGLRLRNVKWPTGMNRDSMVLYTYQGEDEEYSPGYAWGDPDADRLAINTRWLQASCTQGDATITPTMSQISVIRPN